MDKTIESIPNDTKISELTVAQLREIVIECVVDGIKRDIREKQMNPQRDWMR